MIDTLNAIEPTTVAPMAHSIAAAGTEVVKGVTGDIGKGLAAAFGCAGAAFSVGFIGAKAVEAVGRNPSASGAILVQAILGMALAEAVAFYALFLY